MLSSKCSRSFIQNSLTINQQLIPPLSTWINQRKIGMSVVQMNHYKALGLPSNATQNDIKSAYYKLSMLFHPDKNKGSDDAAKKFREITAAYEVLGNNRLRKLYDKGIIHTAGAQYEREPNFTEVEVEDDAQTKFYKAREKRASVPHAEGKTPIYDFDEWSRAHYGSSFEKKQAAKKRYEYKEAQAHHYRLTSQNEILFFIILATIVIVNVVMIKNYDKDNLKKKKSEDS